MSFKIKALCFLCAFWIGTSLTVKAETPVVEELSSVYLDSLGTQKRLPFTEWGEITSHNMPTLILKMSEDRSSAWASFFLKTILTQETSIQGSQDGKGLILRLQALFNLGEFSDVLTMINQIPPAYQKESILQLKLNTLLMMDDWEKACALADENIARSDVFWQKAKLMCQGLLGDKDKAQLSFDLWREKKKKDGFTLLMEALLYPPKSVEIDMPATPMEAFLMKQLGIKARQEPAYLKKTKTPVSYPSFKSAVSVEKLLNLWQQKGLSVSKQTALLWTLNQYAQTLKPELKFIQTKSVWTLPEADGKVLLLSLFLKDKPESEITGADLLLALYFLMSSQTNLENAFLLLHKGGLDVEQWMLEQINP